MFCSKGIFLNNTLVSKICFIFKSAACKFKVCRKRQQWGVPRRSRLGAGRGRTPVRPARGCLASPTMQLVQRWLAVGQGAAEEPDCGTST